MVGGQPTLFHWSKWGLVPRCDDIYAALDVGRREATV